MAGGGWRGRVFILAVELLQDDDDAAAADDADEVTFLA